MSENTLPPDAIKAIYDEMGRWQDTQGFYEQPAKDHLIAHADFGSATSVLEIGCGTGRFAEQVLEQQLPPDAWYRGLELSTTMVALSRRRLAQFGARAAVMPTDGTPPFDVESGSVDRVVANYVFDLLSPAQTRALLAEARRVLRSGGRLGVASLTAGRTALTRLISRAWKQLHAWAPTAVGGCRPVDLTAPLQASSWHIDHQANIAAWGLTSQVIVATPGPS